MVRDAEILDDNLRVRHVCVKVTVRVPPESELSSEAEVADFVAEQLEELGEMFEKIDDDGSAGIVAVEVLR